MTAEGAFPKVDGDVYFASEVNTTLKLIDFDQTAFTNEANTDETTAYTKVYTANSIGSTLIIKAGCRTTGDGTGANQADFKIKIDGVEKVAMRLQHITGDTNVCGGVIAWAVTTGLTGALTITVTAKNSVVGDSGKVYVDWVEVSGT